MSALPPRLVSLTRPLEDLDRANGVYLCSEGDEVVYVGESTDVLERVTSDNHPFRSRAGVRVLRLQTILRLGLTRKNSEAALIRFFRPRLNKSMPFARDEGRVLLALVGEGEGGEARLCECGSFLPAGWVTCCVCALPPHDYTGYDAAGGVPDADGEGFEWPCALNGLSPSLLDDVPGFIEREPNSVLNSHCDSWTEDEERHLILFGRLPDPEFPVRADGRRAHDQCHAGHDLSGRNRMRNGTQPNGQPAFACRECRNERSASRRLAKRRLVPAIAAAILLQRAA